MGKMFVVDWEYLHGALVRFISVVTVGAALLSGSGYFERRMEQEYRQHSERLSALRHRYLAVDGEEEVIKEYLPRFMDLHKRGLLGAEHRLNWIETLQDAGRRLSVPSLSYEIRAQQIYRPDFPAPADRYKIFVSEMTLTMQLLHEGDLFAMLDLLDERAMGFYTVSGCELERAFVELTDNPDAGNVTATCLLEWFSINPAAEPEIKV